MTTVEVGGCEVEERGRVGLADTVAVETDNTWKLTTTMKRAQCIIIMNYTLVMCVQVAM